MSETPRKSSPEYLRGFNAAQDFFNGPGGESPRDYQESPDFAAGWDAFVNMREMFVEAGFIEKDGMFCKTFSTGGK
jgi:hypothetical protein